MIDFNTLLVAWVAVVSASLLLLSIAFFWLPRGNK